MSGPRDANNRVVVILVSIVALMGFLSFAAVPFYSWFCRTTGFAGTTQTSAQAPTQEKVLDRTVLVRFDASTAKDMPWKFTAPEPATMRLKIGQSGLAFFEAYNPTDTVTAGQASYNVSPDQAGYYFTKIACFCFEMQVLKPGERVKMPVTFFVDPAMVKDREATYIHEITLSYTFHSQPVPGERQATEPAGPVQRLD